MIVLRLKQTGFFKIPIYTKMVIANVRVSITTDYQHFINTRIYQMSTLQGRGGGVREATMLPATTSFQT